MADWHVAASLNVLLGQLNAKAPNRSKESDGSIGDAAHASRSSDHNPWYRNTVTARDFTHDPAHGLDGQWLRDQLIASRDPRIKYVIWRRKITSGAGGPAAWVQRSYSGSNPHEKHVHVSVVATPACEDTRPWNLGGRPNGGGPGRGRPILKLGSKGPDVALLQRFLGLDDDGIFGPKTKEAVIRYQKMQGLVADGIVGNLTWDKIGL